MPRATNLREGFAGDSYGNLIVHNLEFVTSVWALKAIQALARDWSLGDKAKVQRGNPSQVPLSVYEAIAGINCNKPTEHSMEITAFLSSRMQLIFH